jgi:hypothetical protein
MASTKVQKESTMVAANSMESVKPSYMITLEDAKAELEARLHAALDEAAARQSAEVASPQGWWDIIAIGPIKVGAVLTPPGPLFGQPLLPNQVIRAGESAFLATVIITNPFGPSAPPASQILGGFALPYEVNYTTGNVTTWTAGPSGSVNGNLNLLPFKVDFLPLDTSTPGLYELNVSARIFDALGGGTPPFSGFARRVIDVDPDLFFPAPGLQFDTPIRYQVYA